MKIQKLSKAGTGHENQDVIRAAQDRDICVIALADGVSSCSWARQGAEIACEAVKNLFFKRSDYFLSCENELLKRQVLAHIRYELKKEAGSGQIEEYSSTIAAVLVDRRQNRMLCVSLGDGLIMGVEDGDGRIIIPPSGSSRGVCTTTTEGAETEMKVRRFKADLFESVLICSDGAWRQMFDRNRLRREVDEMMSASAYDRLQDFFTARDFYDDSSFIAMDLREEDMEGKEYERTQLSA